MTYLLAVGVTIAAVLLRWLLDPVMGDALPLVTLFGAVAATTWFGGYRPAILAGLAGYLACHYLFIPPRYTFSADPGILVGLIAYLFTCTLIIGFGEAARRAQVRASERREVLQVTLRSIGDAVITTDLAGRITYMNGVAESLTGWAEGEAVGQPVARVFRIVSESTREPVEDPVARALRDGHVVGLANHTLLVHRDGQDRPIDDSAAPIRDERGQMLGCVLIFRDVSIQRGLERDRAGQLVTARILASIVESSDDAIVSKSLAGIIQSWNAAAERMFGYTADQAIGRHISIVIPPDRLAEEDQIIASLKAGRRVDHFETERVRSDGRRILVSLTVSPVKDESGAVIGASKIVRDVTRQRHAEQRERQLLSEAAAASAKFGAFFEQGAVLAIIADVDGTIREANRLSSEGCGYGREQIVGRRLWDGPWWAPSAAAAAQIKTAAADAANGQTFRAEVPYYVAGGLERRADVTVVPIRDGEADVRFLALTGTDITDRVRAEADRNKFVTLIENSTDFIGICDLDGVPFFINRAGLELVGLDSIEAARRAPVRSFFFPEDQSAIVDEFFPRVLAEGHGETEVRFRHFKTGEARWMAYKVLTLPDAAGRPIAFATVSQDVTDRRRLEDDLRRLAADLSDADRRKNEFLAMLAHELRNPLAPISNAVHALRLRSDAASVRLAGEMLERQVGQMARLVDDLLDMSRITRGRIELRKERVEFAAIVNQAVDAVRALYSSMNHQLSVTLPMQPVYLDADPTRLAQVVGNLLNNACKFTDSGGQIALRVDLVGRDVVLRVRDNGIGIEPAQLPRLFEMFTQVDTSLDRSRGGLGIGLTLVKTLVELQGGRVEAHSEGLGRGSEFVIRLPVAIDQPAAAAPPRAITSVARRRVLIVDDNPDGAESLALLLTLEGHETHVAHDGLDAIAAAERLRPDVTLLDIGLPGLNGFDVCRRIREQAWGKSLVLVAVTGWGQQEHRRASKDAGFNMHLVKPVDPDALTALLASLPSPSETVE